MRGRQALEVAAPVACLLLATLLGRWLLESGLWASALSSYGHWAPGLAVGACALVFLRFGRIEPALIAGVPVLLGAGVFALTYDAPDRSPPEWFGLFVGALLGLQHAAFVVSTHLRAWLEQTRPRRLVPPLTAIPLVAGFGLLSLGEHAGLAAVGSSGVQAFLYLAVPAQLLGPPAMRMLLVERGPNGNPSLRGLKGCLFVVWTMAGGGLWHLVFGRKGRDEAIEAIHRISVRVWRGVPNGRKVLLDADAFRSPCVIVANHTAMGEVPAMLAALHPVVTLVKDWVWKVPIMGHMTQAAGYINTDRSSPEQVLEQARTAVEAGISLLVFPEGTRSRNWKIGRFHNGAFAIARAIGVPVTPVAIANARSMIGAGRWWIGDHDMHLRVLQPMDPGEWKSELADKRMAREARDRIRAACAELWPATQNGPVWHRAVAGMYRYLGPVVSHYAASKLKRDPLIKALPELCPGDGPLLHAACGYGIMTARLATFFPLRPIRGVDYDARKIQTATAALGETTGTRFSVADLRTDDLGPAETVLLVDLLHYWPPKEQERIVQRLADVLPPGGRFVFRDGVQGDAGQGAVLFFERLAAVLGFTRVPGAMHFRTEAEYRALLEGCGLTVESARPDLGLGSNLVLVCRKPME